MTERQRRTPRQARAGSTVDAILDATLQLLEADGPGKLTTNHIAARAGVSIGTIYQYFRDKNAILAALAERRTVAVRDGIADLIIRDPNGRTVRPIIQALMRSFEDTPRARAALLDAMHRQGGDGALQQHHQAFLASIEGKADLGLELTPERAFILTHAPISLLRAAAAAPDLGLDPEALEDELVRLLEAYLAAVAG
ncbi:MAG: TetR/AcrR family transcriptional regulator [Pseudomonadota bacterium]